MVGDVDAANDHVCQCACTLRVNSYKLHAVIDIEKEKIETKQRCKRYCNETIAKFIINALGACIKPIINKVFIKDL